MRILDLKNVKNTGIEEIKKSIPNLLFYFR
jgi:hypothetical protein